MSETHDGDSQLQNTPSAQPYQVCRSTFCSRSTLPKALLVPQPLEDNEKKQIIKHEGQLTGLTDPDQQNKCCLESVASPPPIPNIWDSSQRSQGSPRQTGVWEHVVAKISQ